MTPGTPPEWLLPLVEERWASPTSGSTRTALVLPDNSMDLIWRDGAAFVHGPDTRAFEARVGDRDLRGLRFVPGALPILLGIDARELHDTSVPLGDLGGADLDAWRARLDAARADGELALLGGLRRSHATRAADLADELGWSGRQLQRKLGRLLGHTARRWVRIRRLNALRAGLHTTPLVDLAHAAGYADQPHMTRECQALTGLTPDALRRRLAQPIGEHSSTSTPLRSRT